MPKTDGSASNAPYKSRFDTLGVIHRKIDRLAKAKADKPTAPAKRRATKPVSSKKAAAKPKPKAAKAVKKPVPKTAKKPANTSTKKGSHRPQCAAATPAGKQCRNSAREGSKYCGSHKGFRPKASGARAKDTKPRVAKAKDTAPAKRKAPAKKPASKPTKNPRCAAKTAAGKRCNNSSRAKSKYCASHKGYRA